MYLTIARSHKNNFYFKGCISHHDYSLFFSQDYNSDAVVGVFS